MAEFSSSTPAIYEAQRDDLARQLDDLTTEMRNPRSSDIDSLDATGIVDLINSEDATVAAAVRMQQHFIAKAVDVVVKTLSVGGRVLYVGAGTSGRIGIVDASEMPPTFGLRPDVFQALIAGGPAAVFAAQEGAEDNPGQGAADAEAVFSAYKCPWVVIGIAASGRTPYVIGALRHAHDRGFATVMITTNQREVVASNVPFVDTLIAADVGPEVITGSTRMKSGTAQKMIINMISTASMVLIGKTYGNVMVDLQQTNEKLKVRARKIVSSLGGISIERADAILAQAQNSVKHAIVMANMQCSLEHADRLLSDAGGLLRNVIG